MERWCEDTGTRPAASAPVSAALPTANCQLPRRHPPGARTVTPPRFPSTPRVPPQASRAPCSPSWWVCSCRSGPSWGTTRPYTWSRWAQGGAGVAGGVDEGSWARGPEGMVGEAAAEMVSFVGQVARPIAHRAGEGARSVAGVVPAGLHPMTGSPSGVRVLSSWTLSRHLRPSPDVSGRGLACLPVPGPSCGPDRLSGVAVLLHARTVAVLLVPWQETIDAENAGSRALVGAVCVCSGFGFILLLCLTFSMQVRACVRGRTAVRAYGVYGCTACTWCNATIGCA